MKLRLLFSVALASLGAISGRADTPAWQDILRAGLTHHIYYPAMGNIGRTYFTIPADVGQVLESQPTNELLRFLIQLRAEPHPWGSSPVDTWLTIVRNGIHGQPAYMTNPIYLPDGTWKYEGTSVYNYTYYYLPRFRYDPFGFFQKITRGNDQERHACIYTLYQGLTAPADERTHEQFESTGYPDCLVDMSIDPRCGNNSDTAQLWLKTIDTLIPELRGERGEQARVILTRLVTLPEARDYQPVLPSWYQEKKDFIDRVNQRMTNPAAKTPPQVIQADMVPGLDWYVANAQVIATVQSQSASSRSAPDGKQRLTVREILKGIDTAQEYLVPAGTLKPGESGVLLVQYVPPEHYEPNLRITPAPSPTLHVWPMDAAGTINLGKTPLQDENSPANSRIEPLNRTAPVPGRSNATDPAAISSSNAGTTSPSPPRSGGLELLGKQRKVCMSRKRQTQTWETLGNSGSSSGRRQRPARAERAGASESLGRGKVVPRAHGEDNSFSPQVHGAGDFMPQATHSLSLEALKKEIAATTPEEVDLNHQVLDALLFPKKFAALAARNPQRATYIRFVIAIRDLDNDAPLLTNLLSSPDAALRKAAAAKLKNFVNHSRPRSWPAVPSDLKTPPDAFPAPLLEALQRTNAAAFAEALHDWRNSGVMRDRDIRFAQSLDRELVDGSHLTGALGYSAYLPPAPRIRPDVIFDPRVSAENRMKIVALLSELYLYDHFAKERADAVALLDEPPTSEETLRRATFWDLRDVNFNTPGRRALFRLANNPAPDTQRFLLDLCFARRLDDDLLHAMETEVEAKRSPFIDSLFDYLKAHRDEKAEWIARLLTRYQPLRARPILTSWLQDDDVRVRKAAAFNLCRSPDSSVVPALTNAIRSEIDEDTRKQMLLALARNSDPRGLDTLLAASEEQLDLYARGEIIRGIARIRDPKALPVLAQLAFGWEFVTSDNDPRDENWFDDEWRFISETVNAFGYISHLYDAEAPRGFEAPIGVHREQIRKNLKTIEQWFKQNRQVSQLH